MLPADTIAEITTNIAALQQRMVRTDHGESLYMPLVERM
jgi:hypothetical protein